MINTSAKLLFVVFILNALYFMLFKGIQAVRIDFIILKVANIRCFILIKCSEQEARFKTYVIMS